MNVDAIVIRRFALKEHDQAVVLYSRQAGKTAAVAKGSLRPGSRQTPALDDGNLIRCELVQGRGDMPVLTGAQAQRCWSSVKSAPIAWAAAGAILQAVDALVYDAQPDERLWHATVDALVALDRGDDPLAVLRQGQASLIEALGYGHRFPPVAGPVRTPLDDELEHI